ncbi:MAG: HPr family phosphocarrier protein [Treponema sp.]|nr:HPr family phosphocarrier protein [Treponema sp.]
MKTIQYVIQSPVGMHARPAGMLVNAAKKFSSSVTVNFNGQSADARKLFALMKLGVKQNDSIALIIDGDDESEAACELEQTLKSYF